MSNRVLVFLLLTLFFTGHIAQGQLCQNIEEPTPTGKETLLASLGGVDLFSRELTAPCGGFQAGIIEARAQDPWASLVVFTNMSLVGGHQVTSSLGAAVDTTLGYPSSELYHPDWEFLDTHFLTTPEMIAGGVYAMTETNDASTSELLSLPSVFGGVGESVSGYGTTRMGETDAFFLQPELQQRSIDLAYVVTPIGEERSVQMSFGILGSGIVDAGTPGGATFGYDGNPAIVYPPGATDPTDPPLEGRVGSIISSTTYTESVDLLTSERWNFTIPVTTAPAPNSEAFYSVSLDDIDFQGDQGFQTTFGSLRIPSDTSASISVPFLSNDAGVHNANYSFTFNDGTVLDATLTANVTARTNEPPPTEPGFVQRCVGASDAVVFAERGGVSLLSVPVDLGRGDLKAAKIVACAADPDANIVVLTNLQIKNAHQVWAPEGIQKEGGTVFGRPEAGPLYDEAWIPLDSHLLISNDMIGGGVFRGVESNDGSSNVSESLPTILDSRAPVTGFGDTGLENPTDAFFLVPEFQQASLEVAYVVSDGDVPVEIQLGVLGSGFIDGGVENGAAFGYDGSTSVIVPVSGPLVPEPRLNLFALLVAALVIRQRKKA